MKQIILFGLSIILSLIYLYEPEQKKSGGILDAALSGFPAPKGFGYRPLEPVRIVSEFSKDDFGRIIETRKGFSESDELITEKSFLGGINHGLHKDFHQGKLRELSWYYDTKGRQSVSISYDGEGNVVNAHCRPDFYFTPEFSRVCGEKEAFTLTGIKLGGKREATFFKGKMVAEKQYFSNDKLWYEQKFENGIKSRTTYSKNGKIQSSFVSETLEGGRKWDDKRYTSEGVLYEKIIGSKSPDSYHQEAFVYGPSGKEIAMWKVLKGSPNSFPKNCVLKRSVASLAPKPSICH